MKKFIFYIATIIFFASCSSSGIVITENDLPEEIFYLTDHIKPYSGRCLMYYNNSELVKQDMSFKDGKLNGTLFMYYKNGNIKRKGEYFAGHYNGKWEQWAKNGKKLYEVHYKNDTLSGDYMIWYPTGVLKKRGMYADNNRSGLWIEYDEAGMIIKKLNYN